MRPPHPPSATATSSGSPATSRPPSAPCGRGFEELEHLGELGSRASVAALVSRILHRQGRLEEAERFAAIVEDTASEDDIWSQVLFRLTRARVFADSGQVDARRRTPPRGARDG